jgi:hypothetical protein
VTNVSNTGGTEVTSHINKISERLRGARRGPFLAAGAGSMVSALMVWLATGPGAEILQQATGTSGQGQISGSNTNIFTLVNNLLGPALIIVVALAPLAIAWGAGAMIFGGRHGPQIMGSAIVAVVLVAACKGIAM